MAFRGPTCQPHLIHVKPQFSATTAPFLGQVLRLNSLWQLGGRSGFFLLKIINIPPKGILRGSQLCSLSRRSHCPSCGRPSSVTASAVSPGETESLPLSSCGSWLGPLGLSLSQPHRRGLCAHVPSVGPSTGSCCEGTELSEWSGHVQVEGRGPCAVVCRQPFVSLCKPGGTSQGPG